MHEDTEICIGCGLKTERVEGEIHRYMLSSPKCWSLYEELLAREYQNPKYMSIHTLTVDAYALQHPGENNQQANSSVYVHLLSAYAYFVKKKTIKELVIVKKRATTLSKNLPRLFPVPESYSLRLDTVLKATTAKEREEFVIAWTNSVFLSWKQHHKAIADIYETLLPNR